MNRRGMFGPLFLILIGVLFLLRNVWPDLPVLATVAVWWPALLIFWGLVRLSEVLSASRGGAQVSSRMFSGGDVFFVVLLCVAGSILFAVNRHSGTWRVESRGLEIFGESHDFELAGTQAVPATARIVFDNSRGNLRITATEAAEIKVTGRRSIRAFDRSEAEKANQQSKLEIVSEGGRVVVRTNHDRARGADRLSSELEVAVPKGASIEARGQSGDFEVAGVQGSVNVTGSRGAIRLTNVGGNARVEMGRTEAVRVSGLRGDLTIDSGRGQDVELENISGQVTITGSYSGSLEFRNLAKPLHFESRQTDLRVEALPGQLNLDLGNLKATNVVGPVRLTTRSRDVRFENFSNSLDINLDRGDIDLQPSNSGYGKIDARSKSGNIEITLPASATFALTGTTRQGEATNDFGAPLKVEQEGRSSTVRGTVGTGPSVNLKTERGSISVKKN